MIAVNPESIPGRQPRGSPTSARDLRVVPRGSLPDGNRAGTAASRLADQELGYGKAEAACRSPVHGNSLRRLLAKRPFCTILAALIGNAGGSEVGDAAVEMVLEGC